MAKGKQKKAKKAREILAKGKTTHVPSPSPHPSPSVHPSPSPSPTPSPSPSPAPLPKGKETEKICGHLSQVSPSHVKKMLQKYEKLHCALPFCSSCCLASYQSRKRGKSSSSSSSSSSSLWICLSCGNIGCGRDVSQHSLHHFHANRKHSLSLNPHTLQCWCYACDKAINVDAEEERERETAKEKERERVETAKGEKEAILAKKLVADVFASLSLASPSPSPSPLSSPPSSSPLFTETKEWENLKECISLLSASFYHKKEEETFSSNHAKNHKNHKNSHDFYSFDEVETNSKGKNSAPPLTVHGAPSLSLSLSSLSLSFFLSFSLSLSLSLLPHLGLILVP